MYILVAIILLVVLFFVLNKSETKEYAAGSRGSLIQLSASSPIISPHLYGSSIRPVRQRGMHFYYPSFHR
jgi:hypothetical protein